MRPTWWCLGFLSSSTGESILNSFEAVSLGGVLVQEERLAVV